MTTFIANRRVRGGAYVKEITLDFFHNTHLAIKEEDHLYTHHIHMKPKSKSPLACESVNSGFLMFPKSQIKTSG